MRNLTFEIVANTPALDRAIRAVLPDVLVGVSVGAQTTVHVSDKITTDQVDQIEQLIAAHDPAVLTAGQQIEVDAGKAKVQLADTIAEMIEWHEANSANEQNAIEVIQRLQSEWLMFLQSIQYEVR